MSQYVFEKGNSSQTLSNLISNDTTLKLTKEYLQKS